MVVEKRSDIAEFAPRHLSPSDSWDDPVGSRRELLGLIAGTVVENLEPEHPYIARAARRILAFGRDMGLVLSIPGVIVSYFRHFPEDPPRASSIE